MSGRMSSHNSAEIRQREQTLATRGASATAVLTSRPIAPVACMELAMPSPASRPPVKPATYRAPRACKGSRQACSAFQPKLAGAAAGSSLAELRDMQLRPPPRYSLFSSRAPSNWSAVPRLIWMMAPEFGNAGSFKASRKAVTASFNRLVPVSRAPRVTSELPRPA
jgi:hypothetical protein